MTRIGGSKFTAEETGTPLLILNARAGRSGLCLCAAGPRHQTTYCFVRFTVAGRGSLKRNFSRRIGARRGTLSLDVTPGALLPQTATAQRYPLLYGVPFLAGQIKP